MNLKQLYIILYLIDLLNLYKNLQLNLSSFITTHPKESIKSFVEKMHKNNEISFYTITRDKDNIIQTIFYNSQELQNSIEQDLELKRDGKKTYSL